MKIFSQSEQTDRIGPQPPPLPKKINPDPDYEVIDFSSQQYSNAAPTKKDIMQRNPAEVGLKCELCGTIGPVIKCEQCVKNLFCYTCDDMFHRHPKRQNHLRKVRISLRSFFVKFISFITIVISFSALSLATLSPRCHQKCQHFHKRLYRPLVAIERAACRVQCPKEETRYAL